MSDFHKLSFFVVLGVVLFTGCGVTPIQRQIDLPPQDLSQPLTDNTKVKMIFYNNSNKFWSGMDGSGKINLFIDGKGVCRLSIGEYIIVETTPGTHTIDLEHRDIGLFKSSHRLSVDEKDNYIQIYSAWGSSYADVTIKPESFENSYTAVKF